MEERPAYSYRDPFSPKSSDDFHDVFGGPPRRRSSLHERPPLSSDFPRTSRGSRDEVLSVRRHWSVSGGEKPAFGEASNSGSGRRRNLNLGEEFYSDIFPGSDSAGSTPKRDGLSLSSNPGSRVLSPNRSVKGKYDGGSGSGAGGGLSLPSQGSLSFRFSHDTVSEANLSIPSSPSSTSQNPKSNIPSPFPSRLRSSNSGNYQNALAGNFHFSFYRWAGKGAILKESGAGLSMAEIVIQGDEVLSDESMLEESVKSDITEESGINTQREFNRSESKSQLKNLQQLFMDENIPNQVDTQMDKKKEKNNKNKQKSDLETDISEEKITGRKTKGKLVREFMKRFNYEGSPKHHKVENENKRRKDKDQNNKNNNQNQFTNISSNSSVQNDEEIEITKSAKMSVEDAYFFASSHMDEVQENNEEIKTEKGKIEEFSAEKNEILEPDTNSEVPDPVHSFNNSESHFDDFEACLVEESIEDQNQNNTEQDQIKISEGKIRNWSKGKEENIRSLLSTLHYVLWEGSGWKPVPLMDIIEVPAVRKSYQKALLCLHPDKLQQRGAKPHQKYIAEKVFDILQEAWNQFSL
ncbi:hypothetical protein LUZ60_005983 [Juncus effusus]|nr:hypothetical protein LUZ60_018940 [Juncus effusus]KAJ3673991.1 hypothetical protein LUZ60_005983 [Juncus effusus]